MEDLARIVEHYNEVFGKKVKSTRGFEANYEYWSQVHDLDRMLDAIDNARQDRFWGKTLTLSILFRKKNPRGEAVDYIEDFANMEASSEGNIFIL